MYLTLNCILFLFVLSSENLDISSIMLERERERERVYENYPSFARERYYYSNTKLPSQSRSEILKSLQQVRCSKFVYSVYKEFSQSVIGLCNAVIAKILVQKVKLSTFILLEVNNWFFWGEPLEILHNISRGFLFENLLSVKKKNLTILIFINH